MDNFWNFAATHPWLITLVVAIILAAVINSIFNGEENTSGDEKPEGSELGASMREGLTPEDLADLRKEFGGSKGAIATQERIQPPEIFLIDSSGISVAPIACVMPPASFAATALLLILSSKVVLPWSTCPRTQTIGWRSIESPYEDLNSQA